MDNAEEIMQCLEEFTKRRPKVIPRELEDYLNFVARTGDPVYQWALVKNLFKEKLLNVITEFFEAGIDIPHYPNVDLFNYETTKNSLLEKIDAFASAPFTIQRICELLTSPRKQYNRIDKFMRAFEKNILVVSTRDPGPLRRSESENGEGPEAMVNGSDSNSDYNVDVEMEDMSSWKENADPLQTYSAQASSSEADRPTDSSSSPFISQNGPAREEQTSPEVELMTIEPDTHLPALEDDLPEPSTSESDLSPSDEETKNNNESDPVDIATVPCISEEPHRAPSPDSDPVHDSREPDVESSDKSENIVSTSQECKEMVESVPDVTTSTHSEDPIEESLLKDDPVDLPISDPLVEDSITKDEGNINITEDSEVTSNTDILEEAHPLPDTSSIQTVAQEAELMDDHIEVESPVLPADDSEKPDMETDAVEDLKLPESSILDNTPPLDDIVTPDTIEDVQETIVPDSSSSIITESSTSPEAEEITQSIPEDIPQPSAPEPISVDPEITSSQDLETPLETDVCSESSSIQDDQLGEGEPIAVTTEAEATSSPHKKPTEDVGVTEVTENNS